MITEQPESHIYYTNGETAMVIFTYNLQTIVIGSTDSDCGEPVVVFTTSVGLEINIIFDIQCTGFQCSVIVFTADIALCADYDIVFNFYYSGMPSVVVQSNVFIITVVNPCLPPPDCINIPGCGILPPTVEPPSVSIDIDVTVTVEVEIELPSWTCGTVGCDTQVDPICIDCDIGVGNTVVIVNNSINIHINNCNNNICGSDPSGNTVIIVIQGCLGVVCSPVDVPVTIYNPCLDEDLFTIMPVPVPQIQYTLF